MKKAIFTILIVFFSFKTQAQEMCCAELKPDQVVVLAVAKARDNDRLKQQRLTYKEFSTLNEFNSAGVLVSPTRRESKDINEKRNQLAGFDLSIGELLNTLASRHEFTFIENVMLNDRPCMVIEFRPKSGLKASSNEDRFINRLVGKLYIGTKDFSLWKVEAKIPEENEFNFRVWRGGIFFVTIYVKNFQMEFEQAEYWGIVAENKIHVEVRYTALSMIRTRKYDYDYRDFQLRSP